MDTQELLQERETLKADLVHLHNELRMLPSTTDEEIAHRANLIAKQSAVNQRLGELKRLLKGVHVAKSAAAKVSKEAELQKRIDDLTARLRTQQERSAALATRVATLEEEAEVLKSRIAAGMERRRHALLALNGLLACEDEAMDDAEWDRRMNDVVRQARTVLSLEKSATQRLDAQAVPR